MECCLTLGEKFYPVLLLIATVIIKKYYFNHAGMNSMPVLEEECLRHVHQCNAVEVVLQDG
jgi:hypothetical protein